METLLRSPTWLFAGTAFRRARSQNLAPTRVGLCFTNLYNTMKVCEVCGKGSRMGGTRVKLRGKFNPTNWSRKQPNLQKGRNAEGKRIVACTDCIKKMNKA